MYNVRANLLIEPRTLFRVHEWDFGAINNYSDLINRAIKQYSTTGKKLYSPISE